jgi:anti-sigma factor RsiW
MTDDDIHDLSGAYVVDAVDDAERALFEAHLADCPACQSEVASLRAAAGHLSLGTVTTPPPSLRESVLRDISAVRPLPPLVTSREEPAPEPVAASASASAAPAVPTTLEAKRTERARRAPRLQRWLVGVAAAAVLATGGAIWHPWSPQKISVQPTAMQQVLQSQDAERFTTNVGAATATIVRSPSLKKAVIVTANMPAAPAGKVYELWLQQGKTMVRAGLMPPGQANTVLLDGNAASANGVGITIEPTGGSDKPTLPPVALIAFA